MKPQGIVEAVGSEVRTVKVGDAVVTCLSAFCGHCEYCVTGRMSALPWRGNASQPVKGCTAPEPCGRFGPVNQMLNLSAFS